MTCVWKGSTHYKPNGVVLPMQLNRSTPCAAGYKAKGLLDGKGST